MLNFAYKVPAVKYGGPVMKSRTIPDQSLSIKEIVRRYVKGIPVDVVERTPVYCEQSEHDLEKLSRMDFGEKAEYAAALGQQAAELETRLDEFKRSHSEAQAKKAEADAKRAAAEQDAAAERAAKRHEKSDGTERA